MHHQVFDVIGMSCGHCVAAITAELSKLAGVGDVQVDLTARTVTVASEQPLNRSQVAAAIDEAGFELTS